ncbi:MAG: hypothetical protein ACREH8_24145 [Opitutaceae bacterium]
MGLRRRDWSTPAEADVRGAKSRRELLAKHRDNAACYERHRKLDPLGFALGAASLLTTCF